MNRSLAARFFIPALLLTAPMLSSAAPQWIWLAKAATENQKVTLRTEFNLGAAVKSATLSVACDNGADALLNGKPALKNGDWMEPAKADVKGLLNAGKNELRLNARNRDGGAAAVAVLIIELVDGKTVTVETGQDWQAAAAGSLDFKPAVVIAKYGEGPWGLALAGGQKAGGKRGGGDQTVAPADSLQLPKGFKAELLYTVPKAEQGSWVGLTVDPKGRLLTTDQYGALYRITVPAIGAKDAAAETKVEALTTDLRGAHGLLYAFGSLYAMVNEAGTHGLVRMRDTDGDGHFGPVEVLRKCEGGGEHGPHSLALSPDGKSLYFCNGNHTKTPENMELSRAAKAWQEDHILPRMWDANGHAKGILAPGGAIYKTDPDGKTIEMVSYGFRNQFDISFDANGELWTYDSDMEWDIGSPWYRHTRIVHAQSGADYGWRSGAGKWPAYYADSLPPAHDIGPGSPTGTVFGTGAKFPAKYQRALFANDWTYGTMYAMHPTASGGSFKMEKEEFVAGKPLPLTDVVIHPKDGAMYFAVGGRRTQSGLYRVTYVGTESTAPAPKVAETPEATLRHEIEKLHLAGTGPEAIEKAWPSLAHADRFVRTAARVAIERQPVGKWAARALSEKNPQAAIEALIALARVGRSPQAAEAAAEAQKKSGTSSGPVGPTLPADAALQKQLIEALGRLDLASISPDLRQPLIRAYQLVFTRMGKPSPDVCAAVTTKLDPLFPTKDALINRELAQLLIFLDSPTIVAKTVTMLSTVKDVDEDIATDSLLARNIGYAAAAQAMQASRPNRQAITLAYELRNAKTGWTPTLRKTYFAWFPSTKGWKGGNSFSKFIENTRTEAMATFVPDAERAALDELSKKAAPAPLQTVVMPKGPGRSYTADDIVGLTKGGLRGRSFEQGKAMFSATLCAACHHFGGDGGNVGPDITGAGNRYTIRDLAENIIEPSKVISDQYGSEEITLKDGSLVVGRVVVQENGKLFVMTSPLTPNDLTPVNESDVKSRKAWNISMMPPGLINSLNEEELKDLIAYLLSGGNAADKAFAK